MKKKPGEMGPYPLLFSRHCILNTPNEKTIVRTPPQGANHYWVVRLPRQLSPEYATAYRNKMATFHFSILTQFSQENGQERGTRTQEGGGSGQKEGARRAGQTGGKRAVRQEGQPCQSITGQNPGRERETSRRGQKGLHQTGGSYSFDTDFA